LSKLAQQDAKEAVKSCKSATRSVGVQKEELLPEG
jgi:hypothetical protein